MSDYDHEDSIEIEWPGEGYDDFPPGFGDDAEAVWVWEKAADSGSSERKQVFGWRLPNGSIVIPQSDIDGSPLLTRPAPTPSESEPMDLAGNFEEPFAPATTSGAICACVCCGNHLPASQEISKYPFRYIPPGWSVNARNKALRCSDCKRASRVDPEFYENGALDVWVDHPDPSDSYGRQRESVCLTRHYRVPTTTRTVREEPMNVNVEEVRARVKLPPKEGVPVSEPETTEEKPTRGARLKKQGKEVAGAFGAGLQLAAANEAGEVLVDIAKELTGDMPMMQFALEHPDGREVAKVMMALMLHTATEQTDIIPQGQFIGEACKLQMTASSFTLIAPRLNKLRKHFQKLAKIGAQVTPAESRAEDYTEAEMVEAYAEMERELHAMKIRVAELEAEEEEEVEAKPARRGKRSAA